VGNPKFQININSGYKDDVWKKPLDRPIIPDEVTKQNRRQKINVTTICKNQCFIQKYGCPNWTFHR
jgi:hypothetical protein